MELLQLLTTQLGISENQAKGGSGLIFKLAKEKLGTPDFSQITQAIPGIDGLISAAPKSGGLTGMISGLTAKLGGSDQLGNLASLAGGFKALDLKPDMISKFIPVILSFVQEKGGDSVKSLLEKIIK